MRSASSDREQIVSVLNLPNHCQIFDQGEANGLQKFFPSFAWEEKKIIFALQFYTRDSDFAFIYFNVRFAYVAFLYSGIYVTLQKQLTTWEIPRQGCHRLDIHRSGAPSLGNRTRNHIPYHSKPYHFIYIKFR